MRRHWNPDRPILRERQKPGPEVITPGHDAEKWERMGREEAGDPVPCDVCGAPVSCGWYQVGGDAWICVGCYE